MTFVLNLPSALEVLEDDEHQEQELIIGQWPGDDDELTIPPVERDSEIIFYTGLRGHGKTLSMVKAGFRFAQRFRKQAIVTNLTIDVPRLLEYALKKDMKHLAWLCLHQRIIRETSFDRLFSYQHSVVLFDEAGIFADARDFNDKEYKERMRRAYADAILSRKDGVDILICAQDFGQVDIKLRRLADHMYHLQRFTVPTFGKMFIKTEFDYAGYEEFVNKKTFKSWLKNRTSFWPDFGFYDKDMFGLYDTKQRLDGSKTYHPRDVVSLAFPRSRPSLQQVVMPPDFELPR